MVLEYRQLYKRARRACRECFSSVCFLKEVAYGTGSRKDPFDFFENVFGQVEPCAIAKS